MTVIKPKHLAISSLRFPRIGKLRQRPHEVLAVPQELGLLTQNPRQLFQSKNGKNSRLSWGYPWVLSLQCLALYQQDGHGFYAACDDPLGFRKEFALFTQNPSHLYFEIVHEPEQEALGLSSFQLPYPVILGSFYGDWTAAAEIYRKSVTAVSAGQRARFHRHLTPTWLEKTGLWIWNRGRSHEVLDPAIVLRQHLNTPVTVLWHWWHQCAYDAGFPEFLPPREGSITFRNALNKAREEDVNAILYMNQRLWGTHTESWSNMSAETYAVKQKDGTVATENYNIYLKAPCAPMCIATRFWRDHYASMAQEVLCNLNASGIYMDQTGVPARCYDPSHGHIKGVGRYWNDGLTILTSDIRDRASLRSPIALAGEFCGEPWIGNLDAMLALSVSSDRLGLKPPWEPIPFFPAVYHSNAILFGNMAGLVHPPYDEKWPSATAPTNALTLLDRKFSDQFYLEQARTFVWGMQPMIANFLPMQLKERAEEIDYVSRLVHLRMRALKYLLHGTWIRPPSIIVSQKEIEVAELGVYTPLRTIRRTYPIIVTGAWKAQDGNIGLALASIVSQAIQLRLPIDSQSYGISKKCQLTLMDSEGHHSLGYFDPDHSELTIALPSRALCILEFRINDSN